MLSDKVRLDHLLVDAIAQLVAKPTKAHQQNVRKLIRAGAHVGQVHLSKKMMKKLQQRLLENNTYVVELMLTANILGKTLLIEAIFWSEEELVALLLKSYRNCIAIDDQSDYLFMMILDTGLQAPGHEKMEASNCKILTHLLNFGLKPTESTLISACYYEKYLACFIDADPSLICQRLTIKDTSLLLECVNLRNFKGVEMLVSRGIQQPVIEEAFTQSNLLKEPAFSAFGAAEYKCAVLSGLLKQKQGDFIKARRLLNDLPLKYTSFSNIKENIKELIAQFSANSQRSDATDVLALRYIIDVSVRGIPVGYKKLASIIKQDKLEAFEIDLKYAKTTDQVEQIYNNLLQSQVYRYICTYEGHITRFKPRFRHKERHKNKIEQQALSLKQQYLGKLSLPKINPEIYPGYFMSDQCQRNIISKK